MVEATGETSSAMGRMQDAAQRLIQRLNDRAVYAAAPEFEDIRALVKAIRQVCDNPLRN